MKDLFNLPPNLPVPQDDGACAHLTGLQMPSIALNSTSGQKMNLHDSTQGPTVIFFYPRSGRPEEDTPADWDLIPGARGCTPQSCGFRDHNAAFEQLGVAIYGVSSQSTEYQQEFVIRTKIKFEILSDEDFALTNALQLPTLDYHGQRLIKRLAIFATDGRIEKVFYPVFPPDLNAAEVLAWLGNRLTF